MGPAGPFPGTAGTTTFEYQPNLKVANFSGSAGCGLLIQNKHALKFTSSYTLSPALTVS